MSVLSRLASGAVVAAAVAWSAPAQATLAAATFDFTAAGGGLISASPDGTYTSPVMPGFCLGVGTNNCGGLGGVSGSIAFTDMPGNVDQITFSFFGSTNSGAGPFTLTLGAFDLPSDAVVTDIDYVSGTLGTGSFGLTSWDGTTATFSGSTGSSYNAVGGRHIVFDVTLTETVPEPASLALLGLALAGLGAARRRRA